MPDTLSADSKLLDSVAAAIKAGDTARAAALADTGLVRGLRHPLLLRARALDLSRSGRHQEALTAFEEAQALSAPSAAVKSAIATCLIELDRIPEAVAAYDAAIALQPGSSHLHYRKGWALERGNDLTRAKQAHAQAIALQPDNAAALARLAFLCARQGRDDEARGFAMRALAKDPAQVPAMMALAMADIAGGDYAAADAHLAQLLRIAALTASDRSFALSILGDLRDAQGRMAEAFSRYTEANRILMDRDAARFPPSARTSSAVAALAAYTQGRATWPPVVSATGSGGDTKSHVFLIGFLRSGTTLLEQVLATHPGAVSLEERDTLGDAARAFMARPEDLERLAAADDATLQRFRALYWQRVKDAGIDAAGKVFIDKTPINTAKLPLIARLFPAAKILFAVRDPRDVVLSCFRRHFANTVTTYDLLTLDGTARFYDGVMRLAQNYRAMLAIDWREVRHETLVDDFEGELRSISAHIGLAWNDAMFDFAEQTKSRSVSTPSAAQIARGLNAKGIGHWQHYREQMTDVLPLLDRWVRHFGYGENSAGSAPTAPSAP